MPSDNFAVPAEALSRSFDGSCRWEKSVASRGQRSSGSKRLLLIVTRDMGDVKQAPARNLGRLWTVPAWRFRAAAP